MYWFVRFSMIVFLLKQKNNKNFVNGLHTSTNDEENMTGVLYKSLLWSCNSDFIWRRHHRKIKFAFVVITASCDNHLWNKAGQLHRRITTSHIKRTQLLHNHTMG